MPAGGSNKFKKGLVLGQYFNYQGVRMFLRTLFLNRRAFLPHIRARSPAYIDFQKLHELGIRHIVFDKDNTLTAPFERKYFNIEIENAVENKCKKVFGASNVAILSNSVGSKDDKNHEEARMIEDML